MTADITERYREKITDLLLSSENIVSVLGGLPEMADELLWKNIIPQQFVPGTLCTTGSYIMYDLEENVLFAEADGKHLSSSYSRRSTAPVYTETTLYFWLVTHRRTPAYGGRLRNDILAREIKNIFSEKRRLGIAPCHFLYNKLFDTKRDEYTGRVIAFKITGFSGSKEKNAV